MVRKACTHKESSNQLMENGGGRRRYFLHPLAGTEESNKEAILSWKQLANTFLRAVLYIVISYSPFRS